MPAAPYIDPLMELQRSTDALVAHGVLLFQPIGVVWGGAIATIMLMVTILHSGADVVAQKKTAEAGIVDVMVYLAHVWLVGMEMALYVPLTNGITATGSYLANILASHNLDLVLANINDCIQGLRHPLSLDFFNLVLYYTVLLLMTLMDTVLYVITCPAFLFTGIALIIGPLILPLQLTPWFKAKFWHWLNFVIMFAIGYRVVASAWTTIFTDILLNFFQNMLAHNYSPGHFLALFAAQITILGGTIVLAFSVPYIAHELFGHGGHVGGSFGASMRGAAAILLFS